MARMADKVLVEMRKVIEAINSPKLRVREAVLGMHNLADGECTLVPLALERDEAGGGRTRFTLRAVIGFRVAVQSTSGSATAFAKVHEALLAIWDAMKASAKLNDGGNAGMGLEYTIRGRADYWFKTPAQPGEPCGAIAQIAATWSE